MVLKNSFTLIAFALCSLSFHNVSCMMPSLGSDTDLRVEVFLDLKDSFEYTLKNFGGKGGIKSPVIKLTILNKLSFTGTLESSVVTLISVKKSERSALKKIRHVGGGKAFTCTSKDPKDGMDKLIKQYENQRKN